MRRSYSVIAILLVLVMVFVACTPAADQTDQPDTPPVATEEVDTPDESGTPDETEMLSETPAIPTIPEVSVEFGNKPFADHTQISIATALGWPADIGITITPDPTGRNVPAESAIPIFAGGEVDILSGSVPLLLGAAGTMPSFKQFFNADIFMGYALLARPDMDFRSFTDFVEDGYSMEEAMSMAVNQMEGHRFAYPAETAIQGFINLVLSRGDLEEGDFEATIAEDARTIAMMIAGHADFQVGGVPARLTLQEEGFIPIITSGDLAALASPSPESEELRAIFWDGWLAHDEWIEANWDTVLRMSGLGWRINQLIVDDPHEALSHHLPVLNSFAGTNITVEGGLIAYLYLHPFYTFEMTAAIFDNANPMSDENIIGSYIMMWEEQGHFEPGQWVAEDFSIAQQVYEVMRDYKAQAEADIATVEQMGTDSATAQEMLSQAQFHLSIFNFLDAARFAQAAVEWAEFES